MTYLNSQIGRFYTLDASRGAQTSLLPSHKSVALAIFLTFRKLFYKHTVEKLMYIPRGEQLDLPHCRERAPVLGLLSLRWDPGGPDWNVGHPSPWPWPWPLMTLTLAISVLNFSLIAWLENRASPQMFSFAATLILTLEVNAFHQNLRNSPLYTAKTNAPLCDLSGGLQVLTPKNIAKIMQNLEG